MSSQEKPNLLRQNRRISLPATLDRSINNPINILTLLNCDTDQSLRDLLRVGDLLFLGHEFLEFVGHYDHDLGQCRQPISLPEVKSASFQCLKSIWRLTLNVPK